LRAEPSRWEQRRRRAGVIQARRGTWPIQLPRLKAFCRLPRQADPHPAGWGFHWRMAGIGGGCRSPVDVPVEGRILAMACPQLSLEETMAKGHESTDSSLAG
jgi:hypothetical protein